MATSKVPSFQEWMQERDPAMLDLLEGNFLKTLGNTAAATAILGGMGYGGIKGYHALSGTGQEPAAKVSAYNPGPAPAPNKPRMKADLPLDTPKPAGSVQQPTTPAPTGKTFNMRGGHSGYGDVSTTVARPQKGTWVFNIKGEIKPRDAIQQAKDIVKDELGQRNYAGISASFEPHEGGNGMTVTINRASEAQLQGVRDANR